MPKIVIREIDNTTPGTSEYANFAVLVPGVVPNYPGLATQKEISFEAPEGLEDKQKEIFRLFDDNGVYELSSASDFEKYIGNGNATIAEQVIIVEGVGPEVLTKDKASGKDDAQAFSIKASSQDDFNEKLNALLKQTAEKNFANWIVCTRAKNTTGKPGEFSTSNFIYKYIEDETSYSSTNGYQGAGLDHYFITKKGVNEVVVPQDEFVHYGNQIAYELLKLGYTVLYKAIPATEIKKENDQKVYEITEADYAKFISSEFWSPLKDKSVYDFRYVVSGLILNTARINSTLHDLVSANDTNGEGGRGDCIGLLDIDAITYKHSGSKLTDILTEMSAAATPGSKYVAYFAPYVVYNMAKNSAYNNNVTFPASFHYLACAARSMERFSEWYAVAGYTRGIANMSIASTGYNFGEIAIQKLQPRNNTNGVNVPVNLIIKVKGAHYLWGNRTGYALDNTDLIASHFLNIRQLCTTIKKQVYVACRRFTFDPNSDVLWSNFCQALRPMLEKMKADQGISDYKIMKASTGGRKALLAADIRIVPIEAVEDFEITLYLEDSATGAQVIAVEN